MEPEMIYSDLNLLGGEPVENVRLLLDYGASCVELMMDGGAWDEYPGRADALVNQLKELPVSYTLHSPCWDNNLTSENPHIRRASLRSTLESIDFAARLGAQHLVVHPGFRLAPCFDRKQAKERANEALTALQQRAKEQGVRLAVENVGYNGSSLYTQEEFAHLLDGFSEEMQYLIDTGHAILNGWDIPKLIRQVGPRLCGLHLHDNDGRSDSHLPMSKGIIHWEPVLAAIAGLSGHFGLILEYNIDTPPEELEASSQWLCKRLNDMAPSDIHFNTSKGW